MYIPSAYDDDQSRPRSPVPVAVLEGESRDETRSARGFHALPLALWRNFAPALAGVFWLIAAALRWSVAPALERLPADYVAETNYVASSLYRQAPEGPTLEANTLVRRRDQTLTSGENHSVIQGNAHWLTPAGEPMFETLNLYGVDRRTRENLAGYGNQDRTGQYLFPPHTQKKTYGLWDTNYIGPAAATFDRVERFRGLEVYLFHYVADGIDETLAYKALPDVPEKYRAMTFGKGRLWIEPFSGVVVNYEDEGVSYFVAQTTGRRVGQPLNQWTQRYTPETTEAKLRLAVTTRRWMRALESWLPLAGVAAGLMALASCWRPRGGAR